MISATKILKRNTMVKLIMLLIQINTGTAEGLGGSMSEVVGLPNNSYKPITNTAWVHARLFKLQKSVHSTRSRK